MNVIICDDKPAICKEIEAYINQNFSFNVLTCTNEKELFNLIEDSRECIQTVILDIVLENGSNGIDVGNRIHEKYPAIKIIFLTGYDDMYYKKVFSGFQPYGFIAKPIQYNILNFFLQKIRLEYNNSIKHLKFVSNYKEYRIPMKDIVYIQSRKRICEIYTKSRTYSTYLKISEIEKELTDSFVRCHQSFSVNLNYVTHIDKNQFVLQSGECVPISRKYTDAMHKALETHKYNK